MSSAIGDPGPEHRSAQSTVATVLQDARRRPRPYRSFSDWYTVALGAALVGVALASFVALRPSGPGCLTSLCAAGLEASSFATLLAFTAVVHLTGSLSGPISINAAEAFWVFSSPLQRRSLLVRRKLKLLVSGFLGGAVAGLMHLVFWNGNPWWLVAFPTCALLAVVLAMGHQGGHRIRARRTTTLLLSVSTVAAGIVTASPAATAVVSSLVVPAAASVIAALTLLLIARQSWKNSNTLPPPELRRVQGARDAMAGAISSGDSGLLLDVVWARSLAGKSFVAGFRLKSSTWRAVLENETRRCLRTPQLLTRLLLLFAIDAVAQLTGSAVGLIGISLGTMVFTSLSTSSLRLYATSRGLTRSFPQSTTVMRFLLTLPTTLAVAVFVAGSSVVAVLLPNTAMLSGLAIAAATVAGLAGGIRWATSPPTQFSAGFLMTEMGPVHLSALLNTIRGIDVVLLVVIPVTLGLDPLLSLLFAVLVWLWVLLRH